MADAYVGKSKKEQSQLLESDSERIAVALLSDPTENEMLKVLEGLVKETTSGTEIAANKTNIRNNLTAVRSQTDLSSAFSELGGLLGEAERFLPLDASWFQRLSSSFGGMPKVENLLAIDKAWHDIDQKIESIRFRLTASQEELSRIGLDLKTQSKLGLTSRENYERVIKLFQAVREKLNNVPEDSRCDYEVDEKLAKLEQLISTLTRHKPAEDNSNEGLCRVSGSAERAAKAIGNCIWRLNLLLRVAYMLRITLFIKDYIQLPPGKLQELTNKAINLDTRGYFSPSASYVFKNSLQAFEEMRGVLPEIYSGLQGAKERCRELIDDATEVLHRFNNEGQNNPT